MAITPTPMIIHLDDRIFFFFWLTFFFFFLSSFIFSSLRLFLFPPRLFVYSNNFCICLFEIRSPSSFFVYFPFSPPSIFVYYNPRLCSSFFALLFFLFVPLALSLFLTSEQNRCFEPWTFFSPALLAQLYMPLILFKLQSFPLSFFSISLYTISLTESTLFSFSITRRLYLLGSRFAYISPICSPKFPNSWCPQFKLFVWPVNVDLLSFSLIHSLTHSLSPEFIGQSVKACHSRRYSYYRFSLALLLPYSSRSPFLRVSELFV